jgi:hypothetical protein
MNPGGPLCIPAEARFAETGWVWSRMNKDSRAVKCDNMREIVEVRPHSIFLYYSQ